MNALYASLGLVLIVVGLVVFSSQANSAQFFGGFATAIAGAILLGAELRKEEGGKKTSAVSGTAGNEVPLKKATSFFDFVFSVLGAMGALIFLFGFTANPEAPPAIMGLSIGQTVILGLAVVEILICLWVKENVLET